VHVPGLGAGPPPCPLPAPSNALLLELRTRQCLTGRDLAATARLADQLLGDTSFLNSLKGADKAAAKARCAGGGQGGAAARRRLAAAGAPGGQPGQRARGRHGAREH